MNTVSLQEQMQVIMERVGEPAIVNADFEVMDDGAVLLAILQEAHADDEAQPWRLTAALDDFEARGGIEALLDLAFEYTPAHIDDDNWSDRYALAHPGALM